MRPTLPYSTSYQLSESVKKKVPDLSSNNLSLSLFDSLGFPIFSFLRPILPRSLPGLGKHLAIMQVDLPTIITNEKPSIINVMEIETPDEYMRSDLVDETSSEGLNRIVVVESHANALGLVAHDANDNEQLGGKAKGNDDNSRELSERILNIIFEYALNKFDDSKDRLAAGASKFLSVIEKFVAAKAKVEACLPAFPFKSANKVYKVLGSLPDKAEELALARLNAMCARIKEIYPPGARVTIISDGITYNGASTTNEGNNYLLTVHL